MNTHKNQTRVLGTIILLTLMLSLLFPTTTVFADDATPPAESSEEGAVPADEDAPPTEEATPEAEMPADETPATEEAVTEEPATEEAVTEEPAPEGETQAEEEPVLAQLPEGTDVVVLNEEGEAVSLATQEAADVIASSDPIWCPDGVDPIANTAGCTDSYTSMTDLLAALAGASQPTANGTIWIEKTYDSAPEGVSGFTFDGNNGNFSTWRDYSLTIQGGWNGLGTTSIDANSPSVFNGDYLHIVNWQNNVTLRNILIDGVSGTNGLEVEIDLPNVADPGTNPAYNVLLENVEVKNSPNSRGAYIDNDESPGTVTINNSKFTSNGDNDNGLEVLARGNVSLFDVVATGNGYRGVQISNTASDASATVQVLGTNVFTGNGGDGLYIRSDGNISLNNIMADSNNDDGADISNTSSSTNATVVLTGVNSFSGNTSDGLVVVSKGAITLANITANNNVNDNGVVLDNDETGAVGGVTLTGNNIFSGNNDNGLSIVSRGAVNLNNITADGNKTANGVVINNCIWSGGVCLGSGDVILTGTLVFTNNGNNDDGLNIYSGGNVSMTDVTATGNKDEGVEVNNTRSTTSSTVTVGGANVFTGNTGTGLLIYSNGEVGLNNITADTNGYGTYIENQNSTTNANVKITGANSFSDNTSNGLYVRSTGAITLSNITANGSINDSGAWLDNDETGAVGGVTITGTSNFSGNHDYGLVIDSRGAVDLTNVIADANQTEDGVNIENCNWSNGITACQGSGDVKLTGTLQFTNNGNDGNDDGLFINSGGNVTMANVLATGNKDEGAEINNTSSNANAFVQINGTNIFTGNTGYGLLVYSKGAITASNVTANGSINDSGARLNNDYTGAVGGVTLSGTNSFSGNNDYGLEIDSKGAVSLNNVTANNNATQFGVNIYNAGTGASGDVTITGGNSFSGNDDYGLWIVSRGAVNLANIIADSNTTSNGAYIDNCIWSSGVCQGSGDVNLTGTLAFTNNGNNDDGLYVYSSGNVTMSDVIATGNKAEGVEINNTRSTNSASVQIGGTNVFTGNNGTGLRIYSNGDVLLNNLTSDANGYGTYIENQNSTTNGVVTISGANSFSGNTSNGLYVRSKGAITLSNVTADGSINDGGAYLKNDESGAVGDVILSGSNSFSGNNDYGLRVYSRGAVNLNNITADGNKTDDGTYIDNDPGTENVTISGTNSFSGNGDDGNDDGLYITSQGNILLNNIAANSNKNFGAYIDNRASSSYATVTMNGTNSISNNANDGLTIYSDGTVIVNDITADSNGAGTADNGAEINNRSGSGGVNITGYYNSFSGNAGPGLDIDSNGNIEVHFATINDNNLAGGTNGAQLYTPVNAAVYCSIFNNNAGIGLNASSVGGSLDFYGMDGFTDYSYNGTAGFTSDDCFIPVYGCTVPNSLNYDPAANTDDGSCIPIVRGCMNPHFQAYDPQANTPTKCTMDIPQAISSFIIPVTGSESFALSCETPMTKLQMLNGDFVTFGDLCGYDAILDAIPEDGLPDGLSDGGQYVSGLNVTLLQDGNGVDPLPEGTGMTVAFKIPSGMEAESFAILRWDGDNWVEENVSLENGYVMNTSTATGTFVLIVK